MTVSDGGRRKHFFALLLVFALLLPLGVQGCGKKGAPVPNYSRQLFSWRNVFATVSDDGCISVAGSVGGAYQNLENMVLELQPNDASCAGCPFVPQEVYRITAADAWESPDGETFRFAYCPSQRDVTYRWRLAGRNVFTSLPPVLTPVRLVGPEQPAAPEAAQEDLDGADSSRAIPDLAGDDAS